MKTAFVFIVFATVFAFAASSASGKSAGTGCSGNAYGSLRHCIVGSATASGDYATTVATGTASRPSEINVVIYTSVAQSVLVSWSMTCTRGLGAGSKSGQRTLHTYVVSGMTGPTNHRGAWSITTLRRPMQRPDSCIVGADAQLSQSGTLRVEILAMR